ncbi:transcriptional regulator [Paenibacillus sp. MAH-36]|uniref:Transcriptional regulator n=1 Tax=Paenibacillus violae TaxID=3077234 RepID=A0ABU3R7D2_9BACL|nr:transcriptional regulator [Paenibacillus sp. PFR10]MDU0200152.1 transcriptional regulator [Paenibacillus sp. PFR10]
MTIRQSTFKHIEDEIRDYHSTVKYISEYRQALQAGESKATALASNAVLIEMERVTAAIEHTVSLLPDDKKAMMHLRYWMRPQVLTWDGIAMKCNANRVTVIRWRNDIVAAIAERLGRR